MASSWDSSTLKKLKSLVAKGLSTSEIGKKIGVSKNAVVGKLNRLGWNSKAGGITSDEPVKKAKDKEVLKKKSIKVKSEVKTKVKKIDIPEKPKIKPIKRTKEISASQKIIKTALEMASLKKDQCRWPIGDTDSDDFHFCGKKVFPGKPYCYEHCKCAYKLNAPKKQQDEEE